MSERRYSDGYRKLRRADEPRRIAYEVLIEVETKGAFANILLPKALRQARRDGHFTDRDAAFTSELVHGTLRAIGASTGSSPATWIGRWPTWIRALWCWRAWVPTSSSICAFPTMRPSRRRWTSPAST